MEDCSDAAFPTALSAPIRGDIHRRYRRSVKGATAFEAFRASDECEPVVAAARDCSPRGEPLTQRENVNLAFQIESIVETSDYGAVSVKRLIMAPALPRTAVYMDFQCHCQGAIFNTRRNFPLE